MIKLTKYQQKEIDELQQRLDAQAERAKGLKYVDIGIDEDELFYGQFGAAENHLVFTVHDGGIPFKVKFTIDELLRILYPF